MLSQQGAGIGGVVDDVPDLVAAAFEGPDTANVMVRADVGTGPLGRGQVVVVQGVLRPGVAADVAFPAQNAGGTDARSAVHAAIGCHGQELVFSGLSTG